MESLPRVAYGPSPPPTNSKGASRLTRSTHKHAPQKKHHHSSPALVGASRTAPLAAASAVHGAGVGYAATASTAATTGITTTTAASPHRSREARRLVEEYWQSVWNARHDPPLYHTYSDRYGGTQGVPYASRKADAAGRATAGAADNLASVPACLAAADVAFRNGHMTEAQKELERALTLLQNSADADGVLTVAALTQFRGNTAADSQRSFWLAEVLRRLGTMELIRGRYIEARELFNGSIAADPLYLDTYLLRASCCEAVRCFAEAHEDYAKYMKMTEPSLEVLAHSGKCAAEAGLADVAREQLGRLLQMSESLLSSIASSGSRTSPMSPVESVGAKVTPSLPPLASAAWNAGALTTTRNGAPSPSLVLLRDACSFYAAHAHFYLGYVADTCAAAAPTASTSAWSAGQLRHEAAQHYRAAMQNADYVQTYEESVAASMQAGDYALARQLLRYLQRMNPSKASYFLDTALACRAEGDVHGELRALSAALDREQSATTRRTTLLARGTVYADELHNWSHAIRDFTLLLTVAPEAVPDSGYTADKADWSAPLALFQRASAYRSRQTDSSRSELLKREDEVNALEDYAAFLEALVAVCRRFGITREQYIRCAVPIPERCRSGEVISALLELANGAYQRHQHASAVDYYSRAIAFGWNPEATTTLPPHSGRQTDQLYLSMAHHVMALYPVGEDMFRVPYEAREAVLVPASSGGAGASNEGRRPTKTTSTGGNRAAPGAGDGERGGFACPPLMYIAVDQHYHRLRSLEPTFFSTIEDAFLDAWEPYHTEVERLKDEALSARAGRRGKR